MEWKNKIELVRLLNINNAISRKHVCEYVLARLEEMDEQAWDMYLNGISLIKEELNENLTDHVIIVNFIKSKNYDGWRTAVRAQLYENIILS